MNTLRAVILCSLLASAAWSEEPAAATPKERPNKNAITTTVHSETLKEERPILIQLPANYDSATQQRYPVLYALDGTSVGGPMVAALTQLVAAGEAPDVIAVGIPNTRSHRERDQTPPFMRQDPDAADSEKGHGDQFLSFIETELIPLVDKQYRTSEYRMIAGHSRAGLFVLYSLLEKPQLFQARFCFSSPFHREDKLMVSRAKEFLAANSSLKSFLYMSVGTDETDRMQAGCEAMKGLLSEQPNGLSWFLDYTPGAVHGDNAPRSAPGAVKKWASQASGPAQK